MAMLDADQFEIDSLLAYRGDPQKRQTIEFFVLFQDGEKVWLPWSDDLYNTIPYEVFCRTTPGLYPLLFRVKDYQRIAKELKQSVISDVSPGDVVYVDLRSYGIAWYSSLDIPSIDTMTYVLRYEYKKLTRNKLRIAVACPLFLEEFEVDNVFVKTWGSSRTFDSDRMTLIDDNFIRKYPIVLPADYKSRLLSQGGGKKR
jgi:hypothetical protein